MLIILIAFFLLAVGLASSEVLRPDRQALVKISVAGEADLTLIESAGVPVFARLTGGDGLPYLLAGAAPDQSWPRGLVATVLDPETAGATYVLAYVMPGRPIPAWYDYGAPLLDDGIRLLLRVSPQGAGKLAAAGVETQILTMDPKPLRPMVASIGRSPLLGPDALVEEILAQVDSVTVYSYTASLSGEWPVTVDSQPYTIATRYNLSGEPIRKATRFVGEHLEELGLAVEYHQWEAEDYPNVIGELTGLVDPEQIFIIGAHLDDRPSGPVAPGADDNASGATATLIAADILSRYLWNCTLRFAFWTDEEQGLRGSGAYAQRAYEQGEQIVGYLNLDMIGYNTPSSPPIIELHADESLPETLVLAQLYADVVDTYAFSLLPEIVPSGIGASDHASFWQYGYTAILGIEDLDDKNPDYHTVNDLLQNLDIPYMTDFVRASIGTFFHMSDCVCLPVNQPRMTWDPPSPVVDHAVAYTGTVSGTQPITYTWDFGGPGYGVDLDTATPFFTYLDGGTYTVTLSLENPCGSVQVARQVEVTEHWYAFLPFVRLDR